MDLNYYKYLKYRNKYISLKKDNITNDNNNHDNNHHNKYISLKKDNITNDNNNHDNNDYNLIGGANCPTRGYSQHRGECWHDALSTIILYSNELSEYIQKFFDSPGFDIKDIIVSAHRNPNLQLFIPLNIKTTSIDVEIKFPIEEDDSNLDFVRSAVEYINNLHTRYLNNKIERTKPTYNELARAQSATSSISCALNSKKISNINNIEPALFTDKVNEHGGLEIDYLINISLINFYLMNYYYDKTQPIIYKYIYANIFNNFNVFEYPIDIILNELYKMYENLTKCKGILIELKDRRPTPEPRGHAVGFVDCGMKHYFYDDNGVSIRPDGTKEYFEEFQWRIYLKEKVKMLIELLTVFNKINNGIELLNDKLPKEESPIKKIRDLRLVLSGFFSWNYDINIKNFNYPDILDSSVNLEVEATYTNNINRNHSRNLSSYIVETFVFINFEDKVDINDTEEQFKYIINTFDNYKYYKDYNLKRLTNYIKKSIERRIIPNYDLYFIFGNAINTQNKDIIDYILNTTQADTIRNPLNGNNILHCAVDNKLIKINNKLNIKEFMIFLKDIINKIMNKYPYLNFIPNNLKEIPILYLKLNPFTKCEAHIYELAYNLLLESFEKYNNDNNISGYVEILKGSFLYNIEKPQCQIQTVTATEAPLE
jgi:hypothetical protein